MLAWKSGLDFVVAGTKLGEKDCSHSLVGLCMQLEGYNWVYVVLYQRLGVQNSEKRSLTQGLSTLKGGLVLEGPVAPKEGQ